MKENVEFVFMVKSKEEKMTLGNKIHEQLRGHEDYIKNNIILNLDQENAVYLGIFSNEKNNSIKITISLS